MRDVVPDPPWKVRRRPCPFFSKGQCFFAEACNFRHDIKITAPPSQLIPSISYTPADGSESSDDQESIFTESDASEPRTVSPALRSQPPFLSTEKVNTSPITAPEQPPRDQILEKRAELPLGSPIKLLYTSDKQSRRAGQQIGPAYLEELKSYHRARASAVHEIGQEAEYAPPEKLLEFSLMPLEQSSVLHRRAERAAHADVETPPNEHSSPESHAESNRSRRSVLRPLQLPRLRAASIAQSAPETPPDVGEAYTNQVGFLQTIGSNGGSEVETFMSPPPSAGLSIATARPERTSLSEGGYGPWITEMTAYTPDELPETHEPIISSPSTSPGPTTIPSRPFIPNITIPDNRSSSPQSQSSSPTTLTTSHNASIPASISDAEVNLFDQFIANFAPDTFPSSSSSPVADSRTLSNLDFSPLATLNSPSHTRPSSNLSHQASLADVASSAPSTPPTSNTVSQKGLNMSRTSDQMHIANLNSSLSDQKMPPSIPSESPTSQTTFHPRHSASESLSDAQEPVSQVPEVHNDSFPHPARIISPAPIQMPTFKDTRRTSTMGQAREIPESVQSRSSRSTNIAQLDILSEVPSPHQTPTSSTRSSPRPTSRSTTVISSLDISGDYIPATSVIYGHTETSGHRHYQIPPAIDVSIPPEPRPIHAVQGTPTTPNLRSVPALQIPGGSGNSTSINSGEDVSSPSSDAGSPTMNGTNVGQPQTATPQPLLHPLADSPLTGSAFEDAFEGEIELPSRSPSTSVVSRTGPWARSQYMAALEVHHQGYSRTPSPTFNPSPLNPIRTRSLRIRASFGPDQSPIPHSPLVPIPSPPSSAPPHTSMLLQRGRIPHVTSPVPQSSQSAPRSQSSLSVTSSNNPSPSSSIIRPHLFFALASDSPKQVSELLSTGTANANDTAGPFDLPALLFSLSNDALVKKTEMVKTLLAHGADPSVVEHLVPKWKDRRGDGSAVDGDDEDRHEEEEEDSPLAAKIREAMNPAIRYYLARQPNIPTRQVEALQSGQYDSLLRARFFLIGQDLALDELMRSVASHAKRKSGTASLSIVLVGPSGHGKSHLASKIGSLLATPVYIISMTNLRTKEDLLHAKSLAAESEEAENLLEFMTRHEGSRCVIILEEIEKTAEKQVHHTLLMPWELGKLAVTPDQIINTSSFIWICTSNAGEELVFEQSSLAHDKEGKSMMTRREYMALMTRVRGKLADELGASIVSRVTAVLPFLPFMPDEQRALASEILTELASLEDDPPQWLHSSRVTEELVELAIAEYMEREGARSIHRAVQMLYEDKMNEME